MFSKMLSGSAMLLASVANAEQGEGFKIQIPGTGQLQFPGPLGDMLNKIVSLTGLASPAKTASLTPQETTNFQPGDYVVVTGNDPAKNSFHECYGLAGKLVSAHDSNGIVNNTWVVQLLAGGKKVTIQKQFLEKMNTKQALKVIPDFSKIRAAKTASPMLQHAANFQPGDYVVVTGNEPAKNSFHECYGLAGKLVRAHDSNGIANNTWVVQLLVGAAKVTIQKEFLRKVHTNQALEVRSEPKAIDFSNIRGLQQEGWGEPTTTLTSNSFALGDLVCVTEKKHKCYGLAGKIVGQNTCVDMNGKHTAPFSWAVELLRSGKRVPIQTTFLSRAGDHLPVYNVSKIDLTKFVSKIGAHKAAELA